MKTVFGAILVLGSLLGLNASATELVSAFGYLDANNSLTVKLVAGFPENGFQGPAATCYVGNVQDVCGLLAKAEKAADAAYSTGDHGTFKVESCTIDKSTVVFKYTKINDYDGSYSVDYDIRPCAI